MNWPPPYQIRKSKRVKRLQLQFTAEKGLEIVVPEKMRQFNLDLLLSEHQSWIQQRIQQMPPAPTIEAPVEMHLLALDEKWQISYQPKESPQLRIYNYVAQQLLLTGKTHSLALVQKKLKAWLMDHAKTYLLPQLQTISTEINLSYQSATVRAQKSRWGSCDSKGHISLNCQLLFLPPHLVRHILIHELCHTRHMNHSVKFWRLVAQFDPNFQSHRRICRRAEDFLPNWLK